MEVRWGPNHHGHAPAFRFSLEHDASLPRPDELTPSAESALIHRLLEDGDNPNDWTVSYVWASDGVYAVVLEGEEGVRAFTVMPEGAGYEVMEVTEGV